MNGLGVRSSIMRHVCQWHAKSLETFLPFIFLSQQSHAECECTVEKFFVLIFGPDAKINTKMSEVDGFREAAADGENVAKYNYFILFHTLTPIPAK